MLKFVSICSTIIAPLVLLILSVKYNFYIHAYTYLVIISWIVAIILIFGFTKMNGRVLLGIFHLFVLILFIVGYLDDLLYKWFTIKANVIYVNRGSSNLIFISEDLFYLATYCLVFLFVVDIFYFLRRGIKHP